MEAYVAELQSLFSRAPASVPTISPDDGSPTPEQQRAFLKLAVLRDQSDRLKQRFLSGPDYQQREQIVAAIQALPDYKQWSENDTQIKLGMRMALNELKSASSSSSLTYRRDLSSLDRSRMPPLPLSATRSPLTMIGLAPLSPTGVTSPAAMHSPALPSQTSSSPGMSSDALPSTIAPSASSAATPTVASSTSSSVAPPAAIVYPIGILSRSWLPQQHPNALQSSQSHWWLMTRVRWTRQSRARARANCPSGRTKLKRTRKLETRWTRRSRKTVVERNYSGNLQLTVFAMASRQ